jgi:xylulose-5-phosphate/fructose-6-phosphate phosphoketolase
VLTALDLPDFTNYALEIPGPGQVVAEAPRKLGDFFGDVFRLNPRTFRMFCPDETDSNRLGSVLDATKRCFMAETVSIGCARIPNISQSLKPGCEAISQRSCSIR